MNILFFENKEMKPHFALFFLFESKLTQTNLQPSGTRKIFIVKHISANLLSPHPRFRPHFLFRYRAQLCFSAFYRTNFY